MAKKKRKGRKGGGGARASRGKTAQPDASVAPDPAAEVPAEAEIGEPGVEIQGGPAADAEAKPAAEGVDDEVDAVLDEDLDEGEDLDALIAAMVAGADSEPASDGAEPDLVVLDGEVDDPAADESPDDLVEAVAAVPTASGPAAPRPPTAAAPLGDVDDEPAVEVLDDDEPADPETLTSLVLAGSRDRPDIEPDLTDAIDLGPESTPEDRDRLLAQAMAHAAHQDARYRVPFADDRRTGRWKGAAALVGFAAAGIVALAPPAVVRPEPPAPFASGAREAGLRTALLLQAQQIEAYRVRRQRLPESLDDLPSRVEGIRYVHAGNRAYQLVAYEADGNAIVFDSANPASAFDGLGEGWWGASAAR